MKYVAFAAIAAVLLMGCQEEKSSSHTEISPGGIEYARLYIPETETVAIQIAWPTDWAFREGVNQAVPYLGADLILAGGAEGYPAGEVGETFADLKAEGYLSVTMDTVFGSLIVPKSNLSEAVKIANAHLRVPLLDQGWLDRLKDGFFANITEMSALPASKGHDAIRWAVLGDVPVRRALSVDPPAQITSATRDDIALWHQQMLVRTGAKIVIAGAIETTEAGVAIDALFAGLPQAGPPRVVASKADFTPRRIVLHVPDAQTSTLIFIAPLPPTRDGGEFEDFILANALGGNDQSVLFDAVRTQLRASYGFGASLDGYTRDMRLLVLSGEVDTAKVAQVETILRAAYKSFRETGPSGDLAARTAPFFSGIEQTEKDPAGAAYSALMALLDGQNPGMALDLKSLLAKVDASTVKSRLDTAFPSADDFVVLAVSPDAKALPDACVITAPAEAAACP